MRQEQKNKIASAILAVLGFAMIILGLLAGAPPPVITGIGFFVLSWALPADRV